jgi:hypothetical protein
MNKFFTPIFILVFITLSTIGMSQQNAAEPTQAYSGRIGKLPIGLEIALKGGKLTGRYCYRNKSQWLELTGTLNGGKVYLVEHEAPSNLFPQGKITGSFDGTLQRDSTITGIWKNAAGSKSLPFALMKERFDFKPDTLAVNIESFSKEGCGCFETSRVKIMDARLTPYVHSKLLANLNKPVMALEIECPCTEESGYPQGYTQETMEILYNKNNLLTCEIASAGIGAYESHDVGYVTYSLITGEPIAATALFKPEAVFAVQKFIVKQLEQYFKDELDGRDEDERSTLQELGDPFLENQRNNTALYDFSLTNTDLIFHVDWDFPHFAQALQPPGDVVISLEQLKPWVNPNGPLGFLTAKN